MVMYAMNDTQFQAVYNMLSFSLASMMATTVYLFFRASAVQDKFKSAVLISGLVTFIAAYHYVRIFNSWVEAYSYSAGEVKNGALEIGTPALTGVPFNDAYRYMDWLLTVPLLLIEILLVMKLDEATYGAKSKSYGVSSSAGPGQVQEGSPDLGLGSHLQLVGGSLQLLRWRGQESRPGDR